MQSVVSLIYRPKIFGLVFLEVCKARKKGLEKGCGISMTNIIFWMLRTCRLQTWMASTDWTYFRTSLFLKSLVGPRTRRCKAYCSVCLCSFSCSCLFYNKDVSVEPSLEGSCLLESWHRRGPKIWRQAKIFWTRSFISCITIPTQWLRIANGNVCFIVFHLNGVKAMTTEK